jgi:hypothetical protein
LPGIGRIGVFIFCVGAICVICVICGLIFFLGDEREWQMSPD